MAPPQRATPGHSMGGTPSGPPLDTPDTLTATEQTGPPGEAESSPLTEFSDFFPTGGGRTEQELMLLFSGVGIAREVLTDHGSCFMSQVIKELLSSMKSSSGHRCTTPRLTGSWNVLTIH